MMGRAGEAVARRELERLGYVILETNFRTRDGEIDLVAREAGQYVFVEVKTRRDRSYGPPEESITESKQTRLVSVAQAFLEQQGVADADWRIDVVVVEQDRNGGILRLEVLRDAVTDCSN